VAIVLIAVGLALLISAVRGTLTSSPAPWSPQGWQGPGLLTLFYDAFVGPGNMFVWILALGLVGSVGYVRQLRPVSDAFLVLIIVVLIISARSAAGINFFSALTQQVLKTQQDQPAATGGASAATPAAPFQFGNYSGTMPINSPSLAPIPFTPVGPGLGGVSLPAL